MTITTTLNQIKILERDILSFNTKINKEKEAKVLDEIAKTTKKMTSANGEN